jgi:hypothetical protein
MAVQAAAADPAILGIALISAADLGGRVPLLLSKPAEPVALRGLTRISHHRWYRATFEGAVSLLLCFCVMDLLRRGNF